MSDKRLLFTTQFHLLSYRGPLSGCTYVPSLNFKRYGRLAF